MMKASKAFKNVDILENKDTDHYTEFCLSINYNLH